MLWSEINIYPPAPSSETPTPELCPLPRKIVLHFVLIFLPFPYILPFRFEFFLFLPVGSIFFLYFTPLYIFSRGLYVGLKTIFPSSRNFAFISFYFAFILPRFAFILSYYLNFLLTFLFLAFPLFSPFLFHLFYFFYTHESCI